MAKIRSFWSQHKFNITLGLAFAVMVCAGLVQALVRDRNIAGTAVFMYRVDSFQLGAEPFTATRVDIATWQPPSRIGTVWVTDFSCAVGTRTTTCTAADFMLEKNGTNMLSAAVSMCSATLATQTAGTLSPAAFSLTSSDKATVDLDTLTAATLGPVNCQITYRTLYGSEAL